MYSMLMTHRTALCNKAEQICFPHVTDKCLQIAIIFLKSYLYIENNTPSFCKYCLRTFSNSTNILYCPENCSLSIILFGTTSFPSQKQIGSLAHSVSPECLISFSDLRKFTIFFCHHIATLLFSTIYYFEKQLLY